MNKISEQLRIQDTLKKNLDTVHFCISQDGYPKRAFQDYANDVRISRKLGKMLQKRRSYNSWNRLRQRQKKDWIYIKNSST